jgi:hypothetical protein
MSRSLSDIKEVSNESEKPCRSGGQWRTVDQGAERWLNKGFHIGGQVGDEGDRDIYPGDLVFRLNGGSNSMLPSMIWILLTEKETAFPGC